MKNKEFQKLLRKNKFKSNSGFTLTELLTGLVMSIFVIGALGFGLMTVLRTTQTGNSEILARNEAGRALDFISDELRRAESIEVDMSTGSGSNIETIAPSFNLPTGGTVRLALKIPGVSQRVIYFVAPPQSSSPWKGPLVLYRWGPELIANGSYQTDSTKAGRVDNPVGWTREALIDKIDDTEQSVDCNGNGTIEDPAEKYKGFFACVVDDDGDGITENADSNGDGIVNTSDTATIDVNTDGTVDSDDLDMNQDGEINAEDNADADGKAITAQLYFTGETITVSGTGSYSADIQTVARARTAPGSNSEDLEAYTMSFRTLDPSFSCGSGYDWKMRTDFGEALDNPNSITSWNHTENRQPQPITISGDVLVISSVPRDPRNDSGTLATECNNSRVNNGRELTNPSDPRKFEGNIGLGEYENWAVTGKENVVAISHRIDFNDPTTFNGDQQGTCDSDHVCTGSNGGKVNSEKTDGTVYVNPSVAMLKRGSLVPDYGGYDANNNGIYEPAMGDQKSLGEFLHTQNPSLASKTQTGTDPVTSQPIYEYRITNELKPNERIIGFEIGHTDNTASGFDLQDNIFVIKSEAFSKEYNYTPLP